MAKITPASARNGERSRPYGGAGIAAASALALAGAAIYNGVRARRAERETPPVGTFVEVDGVRLHFLERGAGPPLVLLHGNGATLQDFMLSGLVDVAAEQYRVIAFDRPGFGYSERPRSTVWTASAQAGIIMSALDKLKIQRPIVLGHSWGTLAALAMAVEHPGRIAALVLMSGYYFPSPRPDVPLFAPPAIPILGDVLRHTVSPIAGRAMAPAVFKAMFSPEDVPANIADWPLELALRPSQIRAAAADAALMVPAATELSERYAELSLPVVIVAGDGDRIAHFDEQSVRLNQAITGSELVKVAGAGHMVHYRALGQVMAAIEWTQSHASEGRLSERGTPAENAEAVPPVVVF